MNRPFPSQTLDRLALTSLGRDTALLGLRPLPPKPVSLVSGVLTWEEPKETRNITHYKIYLRGGTLFAKVPVGQTKITGFTETKVFVTSFDNRTDSESFERSVVGTGATPGTPGTMLIDRWTLTTTTTNITASVVPPPTNGLLAVKIKQDATGGRLWTWDAGSFLWSPPGGSTLANWRMTFLFTEDVTSGLWEPAAPPMVHA